MGVGRILRWGGRRWDRLGMWLMKVMGVGRMELGGYLVIWGEGIWMKIRGKLLRRKGL